MILGVVLLLFLGSLLASIVGTLIAAAIRSKINYDKWRKQLKNVPYLDDQRNWLGNHLGRYAAKRAVQKLDASHKKYGETVAYMLQDRPTVSTLNLDIIKRVVLDKANVNINRVQMGLPMKEISQNCIFTCENDQWRRIRRAFAPAVKPVRFRAPNVVMEVEQSINKLVEAMDRKFQPQDGTDKQQLTVEFNAEDLIRRYSLQLVLGCFYKQYDLVNFNLDEPCAWVKLVDGGLGELRGSFFFHLALIVPSWAGIIDWLSFNFHPIGYWRRKVLDFIKQQSILGLEARKQFRELKSKNQLDSDSKPLDENCFRLKDGTLFKRNMIDFIVDQFHAGKISSEEYFHSSFLLFGAADKTASDCLVFTLYELGVNKEKQDRLRESIRKHGIESEYLAWFINESLRLNPPGPIGASRTIVEPLDLEEFGYKDSILPVGTLVFTTTFTIHRLKKYWGEDADEFRPERWANADKFHPCQFMPFGGGLRGCPGKEFALFEMKKLICALLERYRLECDVKEDIMEFDSPLFIFNIPNTPLFMKFTKITNP